MLPMGGMYIFGAILYAARSVLHNTYSFSLNLFFYSKFRFFCFTFLLNFNFYFSLLDGASLFYLYLFVNFYFSILTFLLTFNVTFLFQIFTFLWGQVSVLQCSATQRKFKFRICFGLIFTFYFSMGYCKQLSLTCSGFQNVFTLAALTSWANLTRWK